MAVIMAKEQEHSFIAAVSEDVDLQKVLCLNSNIRVDDKFRDVILVYAKRSLLNK